MTALNISPVTLAWLFLAGSILTEVLGMVALRYTNGFTKLAPTALMVASIMASLWLISLSIKQLELGITYAIWAASSTAMVAIIGILFYAESLTIMKMLGMALIVVGVVLLNLATK